MRVAVLFSGGKDSTFAVHVAKEQGWDVRYLVTLLPARNDSWMFHHPCISLAGLQAESMGISHVSKATSGEKEAELKDLIDVLRIVKPEVDTVVSGAVASRYQKDRVELVCKELGLQSVNPLWGKDQAKLVETEIVAGFDIIFTGVACEGLTEDWLGRMLDAQALSELKQLHEKHGINIAGEGGEYETLVMDGPLFKKRIAFDSIEKHWDSETSSGYIDCKGAKLIDKRMLKKP